MPTHMKRVAKKQTPPPQQPGFLETAAQAIGSTLGSLALKTGLVTPATPRAAKTFPVPSYLKKTSPQAVGSTPRKAAPRKAAKRARGKSA